MESLNHKIHRFLTVSDGYGSGSGSGDGDGDGYGSGSGCGDGSGYGCGSGYGIKSFNSRPVHMIDNTKTIITHVHGNIAKGFILNSDLTTTPTYVVRGGDQFAHGASLRQAMSALQDKLFEDMPQEERIAAFIKAHPDPDKPYPNQELFDWHHRLTGSCLQGREAFVKSHGLTLDGETTVTAFIALCRNSYGSSVIRALEAAYKG